MSHKITSLLTQKEIEIQWTDKPVTPWGGLVLFSGLARQVGLARRKLPWQRKAGRLGVVRSHQALQQMAHSAVVAGDPKTDLVRYLIDGDRHALFHEGLGDTLRQVLRSVDGLRQNSPRVGVR